MVEISFSADKVVFEVEGWHKLWSLRSRLEIPLEHIKDVRADPAPAMGWFDGFKVAGAAIPHVLRAGTFYQEGDFVFWDVTHPEKTVVVELEDEHFAKLICEVDDPEAAVRLLQGALSKRHP
jgi:hypothetical protein